MRRAAQDPPMRTTISLPYPLPDEATAALIELLHELTEALESQYVRQLSRQHQLYDERQADLWDDISPPF